MVGRPVHGGFGAKGDARTIADIGEFGLIRRLRALVEADGASAGAADAIVLGIGDDAAILRPAPDEDWVMTCDVQVAGRHFVPEWTEPRALGHRAMTVNLSDLAAMGAHARAALVSLGLPGSMPVEFVETFYRGLLDALRPTGARIIGGNLSSSSEEWFCDITAIGAVARGGALLRGGARPGDCVLVTGHPGRSAAGLAVLQRLDAEVGRASVRAAARRLREETSWAGPLLDAYLHPVARLEAGRVAAGYGSTASCGAARVRARAAIDISDGLVGDLSHVCEASGTGARIDLGRLAPDAPLAAASDWLGRPAWEWALSPGDEYELVVIAAAADAERLAERLAETLSCRSSQVNGSSASSGVADAAPMGSSDPLSVAEIGTIERARAGESPLVRVDGLPPGARMPHGWDHFAAP